MIIQWRVLHKFMTHDLVTTTLILELVATVITTAAALAIVPRIVSNVSSLRSAMTLSIIESISLILDSKTFIFDLVKRW